MAYSGERPPYDLSQNLSRSCSGARGSGALAGLAVPLFVCLASLGLAPRALDPHKAVTQYVHEVWNGQNGLPENSVAALVQTRDGYLWMGTQEGLVRFDGVRFTVFDRETTPELRSADIRALVEGPEGALWIGTLGGGVCRYQQGHFTTFSSADGLANDVVLSLLADSKGRLWVRSENGVSRIEGKAVTAFTAKSGLLGTAPTCLAEDRQGFVWVGTEEGLTRFGDAQPMRIASSDGLCGGGVRALCPDADGLWIVGEQGINRWQKGSLTTALKTDLSGDRVRVALVDSAGSLWIAGRKGLLRLSGGNITRFTTSNGLPSDFIRVLLEDHDRGLWVGTQGGSLARFRDGAFETIGLKQGFSGDQVRALYQDREGSLWAGTDAGLDRLKDGKFTVFGTPEGLSHDLVWAILQDRAGEVWIGTENGLNRLSGGRIQVFGKEQGLAGNVVQGLCEARSGALWVGTYGAGLQRMEGGRFVPYLGSEHLSNDYITALCEDSAGALWVGSLNTGLKRLQNGTVTTLTTKDGLSSNRVRALLADRQGNLWVGTDEGLSLYAQGRFTVFTTREGLPSNLVFALHEDQDGSLWIGTMNGGLSHLKERKLHSCTTRQGLLSDSVLSILEDGEGRLWLTSNRGICRVGKADLLELESGRRARVRCASFGLADGMRSFECNGSSQPSSFRTSDGRLWFATYRGAAVLNPSDIRTNPIPPPVLIESVMADGRPVDVSRPGELRPGVRDMEIRYTATSLLWPENVRFRYALEGYQPGWIEVPRGRERLATFTNLSPGVYTFRVSACNSDGVWNEAGASWSFRKEPHFYQTLWFGALCIFTACLAAAGGYLVHLGRLKARQRELELLVQERTRSLQMRTAELEVRGKELDEARQHAEAASRAKEEARLTADEANRAKSEFLANMSHELRTPMNAIIGFSEVLEDEHFGPLTSKQKEHVAHVLSSARHLISLINDILDLAKVEAGRMDLEVSAFIPSETLVSALTMVREKAYKNGVELRTETGEASERTAEGDVRKIKQVLFNLLSNAVKFTPPGKAVVASVSIERGGPSEQGGAHLLIRVADQGIGIRPEDMPKLFQPFTQLESAYTKKYEGTGLGLALTRKLVEMQGGEIRVESAFGAGSTFSVRIPVKLTS